MSGKLINNNNNYKTLASWKQSGRFVHGILLEGAKGSGKASFGAYIAKSILCDKSPPCGECSACLKVEKNIHPDFLTYEGEGGARSFHVDLVREIRTEAFVVPNDGDRKVFLLKNAQEMTVQAQNALLKIIEEPPEGVFFILTCENQNQMLATIRSRVAVLTMETPDVRDTAKFLAERYPESPKEEIEALAVHTKGNIGRAIEILENQDEDSSGYNSAVKTWQALETGREHDALVALSAFERNKQGFLEQLELIKSIVVDQILKSGSGYSSSEISLRLLKVVDIIEDTQLAAQGNVNMLILVTSFPARVRRALRHS